MAIGAFVHVMDAKRSPSRCSGVETPEGKLEVAKVLEELSVDLPNQEVSMFQYAQYSGECQ